MNSIRSLNETGFHVLKSIRSTGHRQAVLLSLHYLETLCSNFCVPTNQFDALEMLADDNGNENIYCVDRKKINARFFSWFKTYEELKPVTKTDTSVFKRKLKKFQAENRKRLENFLVEKIKLYDSKILELNETLIINMRLRAKAISQASLIMYRPDDFLDKSIQRIEESGFWNFEETTNEIKSKFGDKNLICFSTASDVVMTHKVPRADIDITVNFGRFLIVLSLEDGSVYALEKERNKISKYGHIHPFVSTSGDVCFGNALRGVLSAHEAVDFARILEITRDVLINYSPDNPHSPIEFFKSVQDLENEEIEEIHANTAIIAAPTVVSDEIPF